MNYLNYFMIAASIAFLVLVICSCTPTTDPNAVSAFSFSSVPGSSSSMPVIVANPGVDITIIESTQRGVTDAKKLPNGEIVLK